MNCICVANNEIRRIICEITGLAIKQIDDACTNKVIILSCDTFDSDIINKIKEAYVITCGLNCKATVTASSVNNGTIVVCLQRSIIDIHNNIVEPQEYPIKYGEVENIDDFLVCAAACIYTNSPFKKLLNYQF